MKGINIPLGEYSCRILPDGKCMIQVGMTLPEQLILTTIILIVMGYFFYLGYKFEKKKANKEVKDE